MKKLTIAAIALMASGTLALVATAERDDTRNQRGERANSMLEEVDTNGDGNVSLEEVEAAKAARFANADADGDGGITLEEMQAHAEARRAERQASRLEKAFSRLDENEDGKVTADEFASHRSNRQTSWFERMDADSDGVITQAEREAARASRDGDRRKGRRGGQN